MQRHWMVTLQNLPATGRSWDADMPNQLLTDREVGEVDVLEDLVGDVHWSVDLKREGMVYRLTGQWQGRMKRQCARCTGDFEWQMSGETERQFQLGDFPADDADQSECEYLAPPGELNLVDVLREDIWLGWKADVICSENCKGLCQGCGVDLNAEPCACSKDDGDHPFAALKGLKFDE